MDRLISMQASKLSYLIKVHSVMGCNSSSFLLLQAQHKVHLQRVKQSTMHDMEHSKQFTQVN